MKKILMIEDDEDLSQIYNQELTKAGFEVFHAHEGQQGLNMARFHEPDLIILDFILPGNLNGLDILQSLKTDKTMSEIPVIIFTNLSEVEQKVRSAGASDYILKTEAFIETLLEKVRKYIN